MPTWNSFTPVHADYLVRALAEEHVKSGSHGFSVAMKMLDEFYRMARWLKEQQKVSRDACVPTDKWAGRAPARVAGRGAHHRLPAAIRGSSVAGREAFFMPTDDDALPAAVGTVDVQGRGNKQSPGLALNGITLQALEDAFAGYLSEFEALYRAGSIEDYPLFPAGRLHNGIAKPEGKHTQQEATRDTALGRFPWPVSSGRKDGAGTGFGASTPTWRPSTRRTRRR